MKKVILSTALLIEEGIFSSKEITLEEAQAWVEENSPENFCAHQTTKVLDVEPATSRQQCQGYDVALCLAARGRLDFGKEYSVEEILDLGVNFTLITKIDQEEMVAFYEGRI